MKRNISEVVFILDRSGSMSGLENDTIGGYNSFLKERKKSTNDVIITTVLFDNEYELLHDRVNAKNVKLITKEEYFVRGSTALLDAIGKTIANISAQINKAKKQDKPDSVLFVITTDGMENASKEYSLNKIKNMVEHQKEKHKWEFIFLGANIDAIKAAADIGISEERALKFCLDSKGVRANYNKMNNVAKFMEFKRIVPSNWKEDVKEKFKD